MLVYCACGAIRCGLGGLCHSPWYHYIIRNGQLSGTQFVQPTLGNQVGRHQRGRQ